MTRALPALLVLLALVQPARATPTAEHPLEDSAGVISDSDETGIEVDLRALRALNVNLGVMVIDTTGGESIEAYARSHRTEWATGTAPAALFVLAIKDRTSRLEVSDALRPKFPDARAQSILDNLKGCTAPPEGRPSRPSGSAARPGGARRRRPGRHPPARAPAGCRRSRRQRGAR